MQQLLIYLIRAYRILISSMLGNNCRYYPSCSCYTEQAIEEYGIIRGLIMGLQRIGRCHPWHEGGFDPVPKKLGKEPHG